MGALGSAEAGTHVGTLVETSLGELDAAVGRPVPGTVGVAVAPAVVGTSVAPATAVGIRVGSAVGSTVDRSVGFSLDTAVGRAVA